MINRIKSKIFNVFYAGHKAEMDRLKSIIKKHEQEVPYDPILAREYIHVFMHKIQENTREFKFAVAHTNLSIEEDYDPFICPAPKDIVCRLDTRIGVCNVVPETQPFLEEARKELVINLARGLGQAVEEQFLKSVEWR